MITDTAERTRRAITAVEPAISEGVSGSAGRHLEGSHLSQARCGAHDARLVRAMAAADLDLLLDAADQVPNLILTFTPESVSPAQIRRLPEAGVIVSLGRTDTDFETSMAIHLFNAMRQITHREPGLVGAVLARGDVHAGLIADGIHVHPAMIRIATAAKCGPGEIFSSRMPWQRQAPGSPASSSTGATCGARGGRLTLDDGTLAAADLGLARAVSVMSTEVGEDPARAIARAASIPTALLRERGDRGHLDCDISRVSHLPASGGPARPLSAYFAQPPAQHRPMALT